MAIAALRWVLAIPAGIVAAFAAHFLVTFALSLGHGFDTISSFWAASDMNGMPISGTYIVFSTRAVSAAALVGVASYVVPAFHKQVGVALAVLVIVGSMTLLVWLLWLASSAGTDLGIGVWYRSILEFASYALGAIVGAAVGSAAGQERRTAA